jgi:hypothetical protein
MIAELGGPDCIWTGACREKAPELRHREYEQVTAE